jgi:hypothetical protein
MAKPLGFYAGAVAGTSDADILDRIQEQFGAQLQQLTNDDKAAVLICLVETATNTQQVFIQDNFFSNQNGVGLWNLAQQLSPSNQLSVALAIMNQLVYGGQQ